MTMLWRRPPAPASIVYGVLAAVLLTTPLLAQEAEEHRDLTGTFVERGSFDKSILIPGTSVSFLFGGYVKLDAIVDLDPIGNNERFKVYTVPVEGTPEAALGGGLNMHAKQSRFNLDFRSDTPKGLFRAYLETDFYGDGTVLRLRHAYGVLGHLLAGQTWSTFMDISAQPVTVDFEASEPFIFVLRQAQIRWEQPIGQDWRWGVALEQPDAQIEVPAGVVGQVRGILPEFVARARFERSGSHVQLAGIVRQLRFDTPEPATDVTATGWGLNLTGRLKVFARDNFRGMVAYGRGISRYVKGLGTSVQSDAVLTPAGDLEVIPGFNFTLGYLHYWTGSLRSGATFGIADLDVQPAQADDDIARLWSWHVNLIWSPWPLVNVAAEFMQGRRIDKDDAQGTANRSQIAFQYKFH